jgi:lambda family phage tail tape measure protein
VMIELRRNNIDAMSAEGQAALTTAKMFEEEAKAKQRSIELMDEFRGGASNALADIVTGAKSAKEAFADFFDDLARRITQMIAEKWIERAFGSFGTSEKGSAGGWLSSFFGLLSGSGSGGGGFTNAFAKGGAFDGGLQKFAAGGVVNSPTMFRMGLMGEAGPEAILPLHRGPDGKLGVRMEVPRERQEPRRIMRGGDTTIVIQERTNRRSVEQVERAAGRGARRGMTRTGG